MKQESVRISIPKGIWISMIMIFITGFGGGSGFVALRNGNIESRLIRVEEKLNVVSDEVRELKRVLNLRPSLELEGHKSAILDLVGNGSDSDKDMVLGE